MGFKRSDRQEATKIEYILDSWPRFPDTPQVLKCVSGVSKHLIEWKALSEMFEWSFWFSKTTKYFLSFIMPRSWVVSEINAWTPPQISAFRDLCCMRYQPCHCSLFTLFCALFWKPIERLNSKLKENMKCKFVKEIDKTTPWTETRRQAPLKGATIFRGRATRH